MAPPQANAAREKVQCELPVLTPAQDEAILHEAGFRDVRLFLRGSRFGVGWGTPEPTHFSASVTAWKLLWLRCLLGQLWAFVACNDGPFCSGCRSCVWPGAITQTSTKRLLGVVTASETAAPDKDLKKFKTE